jgi:uncharacterized repeat protein (TIGR03803 family)
MEISKWNVFLISVFLCGVVSNAAGQIYTTLLAFNGANGANPFYVSLVQGTDGNLYGTTQNGGDYNQGTVFKITPTGTLTTLYSFCAQPSCADGAQPFAGLVLATDGNFYGTTLNGGTNSGCAQNCGTFFRITADGTLTTMFSFGRPYGSYPYAAPIQGSDGNLYGTTYAGGSGGCGNGLAAGCGTVYKMTLDGRLQTFHDFTDFNQGVNPIAAVIEATDGNLYGTTASGGPGGVGTIFRITPGGRLTTLHVFGDDEGFGPEGALTQTPQGFLGTNSSIPLGEGTVFRMRKDGDVTVLHVFDISDGANPVAGLTRGTDGNFYGTTFYGYFYERNPPCSNFTGCGTLFTMTPSGTLTPLYSFRDLAWPAGELLQATNGIFYGTGYFGGDSDDGGVFSLDMGLGPFVAFVRDAGKVGGTGGILGQGFMGATGVSFNGTPATFKVASDTFIKAKVPAGATTGPVTVNTSNGTLTSNTMFMVTPQLLNFSPPSGPIGTQVTISGVSLTQTEVVGFGDRVAAQFTVNSDTQVTATVPDGAKTGKIGLKTQGGTALSAGTFVVTQ